MLTAGSCSAAISSSVRSSWSGSSSARNPRDHSSVRQPFATTSHPLNRCQSAGSPRRAWSLRIPNGERLTPRAPPSSPTARAPNQPTIPGCPRRPPWPDSRPGRRPCRRAGCGYPDGCREARTPSSPRAGFAAHGRTSARRPNRGWTARALRALKAGRLRGPLSGEGHAGGIRGFPQSDARDTVAAWRHARRARRCPPRGQRAPTADDGRLAAPDDDTRDARVPAKALMRDAAGRGEAHGA